VTEIEAARFMTEIFGMWTEADVDARRAVIQSHFDEAVQFHDPDGESVGYADWKPSATRFRAGSPGRGSRSRELPGHSVTPSAPSGTSGRLATRRPSAAWTLSS
jgi:hypothetical protein